MKEYTKEEMLNFVRQHAEDRMLNDDDENNRYDVITSTEIPFIVDKMTVFIENEDELPYHPRERMLGLKDTSWDDDTYKVMKFGFGYVIHVMCEESLKIDDIPDDLWEHMYEIIVDDVLNDDNWEIENPVYGVDETDEQPVAVEIGLRKFHIRCPLLSFNELTEWKKEQDMEEE